MKTPPRSVRWGLAGLAVLSGCIGGIGAGPAEPPAGATTPPGSPPPPGINGGGEPPAGPPDPGRVTLRRLTRREYNNTARDLLGTRLRPADAFASDPAGFGYDNNADVQSLTPLQLEQYVGAAETLAREALAAGAARFAARAGIPSCDLVFEGDCQARLVRAFARRAFRRPISEGELARLLAIGAPARAQGADAFGQLELVLTGVLSSPHFLFRVELDPDPTSLEPHPLAPHELAARLSYFLWSSTPDGALLDAAEKDGLRSDTELRTQTIRLLVDPRAAALVDSFAAQWLSLPGLEQHEVDGKQFTFDRAFAGAIRNQTLAFVRELLTQDLPVNELLLAPFTFLDDRLATHYGLPAVGSASLTKVMLADDRRRGLLTQAAILTRTSFPARTSPTVRGAWIATHLLCSPPPPPPANVPALPEPAATASGTVRQRLEAHRSNPACAGCHTLIDPLGLGLEHYDLVGRYRTTDRGQPIDASGVLPDGTAFRGAAELSALLAADPRLPDCLARNLMTFALGRGLEPSDEPALAAVVKGAARASGIGLQGLILEVAASKPFRMRRGEPAPAPTPTPMQGGDR
jgi:hypothetical protein